MMAPMQGLTEVEFRNAWSVFFSGIDIAISPFIPLSESLVFRSRHVYDVLPERNRKLPVIPQILGNNPEKFIHLSQRLAALGYESINWNLGCPVPSVAKKMRGSGLLPFPDKIRHFLDYVVPKLPCRLSIKTRLGYNHPEEFYPLIEVYNDYPLEFLVIHPRLGIQMYEGKPVWNVLQETIDKITHPIVYSGDLFTAEFHETLRQRFPEIAGWMFGRGLLMNPFLPEILKKGHNQLNEEIIRNRQYHFLEELTCELKDTYRRERTVLNKLKEYWRYFSYWFIDRETIFSTITRIQSLSEFLIHTRQIVLSYPLRPFDQRKLSSDGE